MVQGGLSPRKQNLTLYIMDGFDRYEDLLGPVRLPHHRQGVSLHQGSGEGRQGGTVRADHPLCGPRGGAAGGLTASGSIAVVVCGQP